MCLVTFAEKYVAENKLARNPVHSASRFKKLMGGVTIYEITADLLREFRRKAEEVPLAAWTIRDTMKDLQTLAKSIGNTIVVRVPKPPEPNPQPIPLSRIESIWPHLAPWSKQWLVIAFWTGLRLADSIRFQREMVPTELAWQASKTKHRHKWPTMPWMAGVLQPVTLPYTSTSDWSKVIVRAEIDRVCSLAGVERFQPQQIRDTGLREWCRADFHVGQVLHGCKLGVIGHYVGILDILEPVAPRVRVPKCFGGSESEDLESTLLFHYRKLDPAAKGLIAGTAERLATG